ncbi:SDR family NAD(P)-dependent oxidoreductase [Usitatibacter palustris]|uniref:1-deoxy-11-beta-hydroxypentalenate dehydrogenase n=1 Tax=Usitatibacter palustris TaxID=2732487 RepID=A0A6M4H1J2_9PROT|nr:SDR family NAD(P)-dependent oxidoreductase [Usitatibacter palustris]QJR13366.1 1-deoxy-11-beta-hydroxypentalenate dehydrogenase [Usitatibacter palustris]
MKDLRGKTAVITGAASGLGLAFAKHAAGEGMRLVLADLDAPGLAVAAKEIGGDPATMKCDVSVAADIQKLADTAFDRFGNVHLLFNNAGVALSRRMWEFSEADWNWVMDVNTTSVASAVRSFVPRMIEKGEPGWIVNTASAAGLVSVGASGAYNASKHAVVTISETLREDLTGVTDKIGVSVLCPAWVPTRIHEADRARPDRFGAAAPASAEIQAIIDNVGQAVRSGRLSPDDIARIVFEAIAAKRFYIVPHGKIGKMIRARMEAILEACEFSESQR